jgi:hypothetical protein
MGGIQSIEGQGVIFELAELFTFYLRQITELPPIKLELFLPLQRLIESFAIGLDSHNTQLDTNLKLGKTHNATDFLQYLRRSSIPRASTPTVLIGI